MNDTVHIFSGPTNSAYDCLYFAETGTQQYSGTTSVPNMSRTLIQSTSSQFANLSYLNEGLANSLLTVYNPEPTNTITSLSGGTSVTHGYAYPPLWNLVQAWCYNGTDPNTCHGGVNVAATTYNRPYLDTLTTSDNSANLKSTTTFRYSENPFIRRPT